MTEGEQDMARRVVVSLIQSDNLGDVGDVIYKLLAMLGVPDDDGKYVPINELVEAGGVASAWPSLWSDPEEPGVDPGHSETIVSAALCAGDTIISQPAPARHHHLMQTGAMFHPSIYEQGLLASTGRFVTRTGAKVIADAAGQTLPRKPGGYDGDELFSEDLW